MKGGSIIAIFLTRCFQLIEFHFHTPAENVVTVDGRSRNVASAHLVHRNVETNELAVVEFLYYIGSDSTEIVSEVYERVKQINPDSSNIIFNTSFFVYMRSTFNELRDTREDSYWYFVGSLTTPPCTEGVHWHVMKKEFPMTDSQFAIIHRVLESNARPVQRVFGGNSSVPFFNAKSLDETVTTNPYQIQMITAIIIAVSLGIFLIAFFALISLIKRRKRSGNSYQLYNE